METLSPQLVWIAVAVAGALVVALLFAAGVRKARSARLRERFGSEYERTVRATGSRTRAERDLTERVAEAKSFEIRSLTTDERARYRNEWTRIEARFVERPATAVVEADELLRDIMLTCGYPMGDFEKHASLLSVNHPRVVEHYRAGHQMIDRGTSASTEDLRQAMLHYRRLIDELLGPRDLVRDVASVREVEEKIDREKPRPVRDEEERRM